MSVPLQVQKTRPFSCQVSPALSILGGIAAGRGLEAVVTGDEACSLATKILLTSSGGRRYLLRVVGQSMIGARIEDEDLLVVEEDENPSDGAVVVALLRDGEEVTVKKLYREGEMVRLKPQNGEHEDLVISAREVRIQGRVVHVIHRPGRFVNTGALPSLIKPF